MSQGVEHDLRGFVVAVGPPHAIGCYGRDHNAWVVLGEGFIRQVQGLDLGRWVACDQYVRPLDQTVEDVLARRCGDVEGDATLVPVVG